MFDQDHGLIHPFTAKDNQHLITNLHQNNSNDVFMFPLQGWSHLRRAEHRKLGQLCSIRSSASRENYQGGGGWQGSGTMVPEGWYLVQHCANVVEPGTKGRGTGTKLI